MANSRRVEKLAALLKREISELLLNGIRDERIQQAMITITSVEVSGDLQPGSYTHLTLPTNREV